MRILHLVHRSWPYHGGAERYVLEHALAGIDRGHESVIATTNAWDMSLFVSREGERISRSSDLYRGITIRRFPVRHPPMQNLFRALLRRIRKCGRDRFYYPNPFVPSLHRWLSRERGFDLVHANAMPFMLYEGWRYCRKHGAGLVSVPHANVGEKYRRVRAISYFSGCQPAILRESTFTVAQSSFEMELFEEMGVPPERIHLSGSGIDPSEFAAADGRAGRRRAGLTGPVVLSLTAHCMDRGIAEILQAASRAMSLGLDFTLVLAGPVHADAMRYLDENLAGLDMPSGKIVITGYVDRKERVDLLAAADVVVLPSRLDCFGIVILEAWMVERPVIGCWSGAMPEMIRDGENGFLVSWGDWTTLAHRLEILLRDPGLRASMGRAGRIETERSRTWKNVTDRFYRRLAQSRAGTEGK